jgi:hypothetical protein
LVLTARYIAITTGHAHQRVSLRLVVADKSRGEQGAVALPKTICVDTYQNVPKFRTT